MNLRQLSSEELRIVGRDIRESWKTDERNVMLALCLKDGMRKGQKAEVMIAACSVLAMEWLADYLKAKYSATASVEDCVEITLSLVRESVTVAGVLP